MNAIGRMLKIEPSTILYWVKNFALKTYQKPTPQGEVIIELDEMWYFLCSKKKNKVWVWKAYCRTTGELVDWACGNRSTQTLRKMLNRLQGLNVKVFFADNWGLMRN